MNGVVFFPSMIGGLIGGGIVGAILLLSVYLYDELQHRSVTSCPGPIVALTTIIGAVIAMWYIQFIFGLDLGVVYYLINGMNVAIAVISLGIMIIWLIKELHRASILKRRSCAISNIYLIVILIVAIISWACFWIIWPF